MNMFLNINKLDSLPERHILNWSLVFLTIPEWKCYSYVNDLTYVVRTRQFVTS